MVSNGYKKALSFLNNESLESKPAPKTDARPEEDPKKTLRVLGEDAQWNEETRMWHGSTFMLDDATVQMLISHKR